MESVNPKSSCCWPFSMCCGGTDNEMKKPLTEDYRRTPPRSDETHVKTPGSTPTKPTAVQASRTEGKRDFV